MKYILEQLYSTLQWYIAENGVDNGYRETLHYVERNSTIQSYIMNAIRGSFPGVAVENTLNLLVALSKCQKTVICKDKCLPANLHFKAKLQMLHQAIFDHHSSLACCIYMCSNHCEFRGIRIIEMRQCFHITAPNCPSLCTHF